MAISSGFFGSATARTKIGSGFRRNSGDELKLDFRLTRSRENDYIAFAEYYNEPIRRSFGNCDIYNTTITWLRKHDHMARYFPIFLVFGAKFQYFDNGE